MPRANTQLHGFEIAVRLRALGGRGADTAERAVAEEDRIWPTTEVVALKVETVAVVGLREKIPLPTARTHTADRKIDRRVKKILLSVVDVERAACRPFGRGLEIGDAERIDELAGDHRISDRRIAQFTGEATACQRTGGSKAVVLIRAHFKRREYHRITRNLFFLYFLLWQNRRDRLPINHRGQQEY